MKKQNSDQTYIAIGKIGSPHSLRGWFKIHAFTEHVAHILDYQPWFITDENGHFLPLPIECAEKKGDRIMAKIQGVNTPEAARLYSGQLLSILRSQLPTLKEDEYYWSDLEGLTVIDQHGNTLGKVSYLIATGSNDVLIVKGEDKEIAIPYLPGQVVKKVNLLTQEIHIEWDELR